MKALRITLCLILAITTGVLFIYSLTPSPDDIKYLGAAVGTYIVTFLLATWSKV